MEAPHQFVLYSNRVSLGRICRIIGSCRSAKKSRFSLGGRKVNGFSNNRSHALSNSGCLSPSGLCGSPYFPNSASDACRGSKSGGGKGNFSFGGSLSGPPPFFFSRPVVDPALVDIA